MYLDNAVTHKHEYQIAVDLRDQQLYACVQQFHAIFPPFTPSTMWFLRYAIFFLLMFKHDTILRAFFRSYLNPRGKERERENEKKDCIASGQGNRKKGSDILKRYVAKVCGLS